VTDPTTLAALVCFGVIAGLRETRERRRHRDVVASWRTVVQRMREDLDTARAALDTSTKRLRVAEAVIDSLAAKNNEYEALCGSWTATLTDGSDQ
jgi:hypothetical protein